MHAAGGDVIVKSEQGKGSKFIINFKVQAAHLKVAAIPVLTNQD
jgi:signal transduction histidine kinase